MLSRLRLRFQDTQPTLLTPEGERLLARWAGEQRWTVYTHGGLGRFHIEGVLAGHTWRLERGHATRPYLKGYELRGRVDCGVSEGVEVAVLSRPVFEQLKREREAADAAPLDATPLLDERRWLRDYEAVSWPGMPPAFWDAFAVLTSHRAQAQIWLHPVLADMMVSAPVRTGQDPASLSLLLAKGRVYFRMGHAQADVTGLQHGTRVFLGAAESAISGLSPEVAI